MWGFKVLASCIEICTIPWQKLENIMHYDFCSSRFRPDCDDQVLPEIQLEFDVCMFTISNKIARLSFVVSVQCYMETSSQHTDEWFILSKHNNDLRRLFCFKARLLFREALLCLTSKHYRETKEHGNRSKTTKYALIIDLKQ